MSQQEEYAKEYEKKQVRIREEREKLKSCSDEQLILMALAELLNYMDGGHAMQIPSVRALCEKLNERANL